MRTDEERVTDLLCRLDDEPDGPPRIDGPGAIREVRRRRRNRRAAVARAARARRAGGCHPAGGPTPWRRATPAPAGVSASPVPPTPKPSPPGPWQGEREAALLPAPDSAAPFSEVTGGDPDGRWLVGHLSPKGWPDHRAPIWDAGRAREVEIPGTYQELRDVNRAGLRWARRWPPVELQAWAGTRRSARPPGRNQLRGSERGQRRRPDRRLPDRRNRAWGVWDSYESPAVDLPLPGPGWAGTAIGIDED